MTERTDTERLDWLDRAGLVVSVQEGEQQDGSDVTYWMVGADLDPSNGWGFGKTVRAAIDNAMQGEADSNDDT